MTASSPTRTSYGSSDPKSRASVSTRSWESHSAAPGRATRCTVVPGSGRASPGSVRTVYEPSSAAVHSTGGASGVRALRLTTRMRSATTKQASSPMPNCPRKSERDLLDATVVALGTAPDRGEQVVHVGLGEPDAGVLDPQRAALGEQPHPRRRVGLLGPPGGDRVHGVLQQLAQIDLRAGIEVMREQIHQATQIDLEGMRRLGCLRSLGCLG